MALLHRGFEGGRVDFMQRALIDHGIGAVPFILLVIDGQVLDAGDDAFSLHPLI